VCDCDDCHKSVIVLSRSMMVRHSHLLARYYLGTMYMCTTVVKYSVIYGISYRYHRFGTICMLEDKDKYRGSSLPMAFRIFRCHRALKPTVVSLDTFFEDLKPT
jgi:hypothetical protein